MLPPDLNGATTLIADQGATACILPKKNREEQIAYREQTYKKRHEGENMFAKLKDRRRIATRCDRCAHNLHLRNPYRRDSRILAMSPEPGRIVGGNRDVG